MKFHAQFVQVPGLAVLTKVSSALQRVLKNGEAVSMRLSRSKGVILRAQRSEEFLFVVKFAFEELFVQNSAILESKRNDMSIAFEIEAVNLWKATRAAEGSLGTSVKLSLRQKQPVLSFHIEIAGLGENFVVVQ
eukprot:Lankesteria_metandrocarpae@DN3253_c0_g1_i3.p2